MTLIPVSKENINFYRQFEASEDLPRYQSRIYPNDKSSYLRWMYIVEDQHYIGSIWLEGENTQLVKLGVFLAEPSYREKGIGKQAIQQMIAMAKSDGVSVITLHVRVENIRARNAYTSCGFQITKRFRTEKGIDAFSMELELF